jgi:hypothetical protein
LWFTGTIGLGTGFTGSGAAAASPFSHQLFNKVLEIREFAEINFLGCGGAAIAPSGRAARGTGALKTVLIPVLTEAIVLSALGGVCKYIVGFVYIFEPFLSRLIAGIQVWMILSCQASIGTLDVVVGGIPRDAQDIIIVSKVTHVTMMS